MKLLLRLLMTWLALATTSAAAQDLIRSRGVWEDKSGQVTFQQASAQSFETFKGLMVRGYSQSAFWIRLEVAPQPNEKGVLLRIRPTLLDEVQLFELDPGVPGQWRMRLTGDYLPFAASERSSSALGFLVEPQAPFSVYYLRLQTTSSAVMHVQALSLAEAHRKDAFLGLMHIASMTVLGWVLLWTLGAWYFHRQPLAGEFALYQLSNILYLFLVSGLGAALEPVSQIGLMDRLSSLSAIATLFFGLWFNRAVFKAYEAPKPALWVLNLLCVCVLAVLGLFLSGDTRAAMQFNTLLAIITAFSMAGIPLSIRKPVPLMPSLLTLRLIFFVVLWVMMAALLPLMGWFEAVEWTLQGNVLYGMLAALLMLLMLSEQARLRRAHAKKQSNDLLRLQSELESRERQAEEHRQFLDMLTHEVKTPLSMALISVGAMKSDSPYLERIRRALGNINSLVDRLRLSGLAEHQRLTPIFGPCNFLELVYECVESSAEPERVKVLEGPNPEVKTDSQLLAVVVNNLLDNALKYSPPNTSVNVELFQRGDAVHLRVSNSLGSAPAPVEARLFSKYYRAPDAQGKSGSGLGLYLSRNIAELLSAKLRYLPTPGSVTFELCLNA